MYVNDKRLEAGKKILVTGGAGFIGFHLSRSLLESGCSVIGFDNMNHYYDTTLKEDRLKLLQGGHYEFYKGDLADRPALEQIFSEKKPDIVVNLAAQAGVRYSIDHPDTYIQSNIIGFYHLLECCRKYPVAHLVYASSSSVYGANKKVPFSTADPTDHPVSLYAATKKSNELMAYCYSKLYGIAATGLRFFTVYGPYGRPDMAYFQFTDKIMCGEAIQVYNHGNLKRDFTYIDDIVDGMIRVLAQIPPKDENGARCRVYNIGNHRPEKLMDFIKILENCLGKKAVKEFLPMQAGDVYQTYADISDISKDLGFSPRTGIEEGIRKFVEWYVQYYGIKKGRFADGQTEKG